MPRNLIDSKTWTVLPDPWHAHSRKLSENMIDARATPRIAPLSIVDASRVEPRSFEAALQSARPPSSPGQRFDLHWTDPLPFSGRAHILVAGMVHRIPLFQESFSSSLPKTRNLV